MSGKTSIHQLLDTHDINLYYIEEFLKRNPSCINTRDDYDRTPLLIALRDNRCSVDLLKLLIRFGADVNYKSNRGDTLLHTAVRFNRGDEAIIRVLLGADVDLNACGKWDDSVICAALRWNAPKNIINLLLEAGVPQDACKSHGSVMHCAASFVLKEDIVNLLIEERVNVNNLNRRGQSPMCLALQGRRDIKMLLKAGGSFSACHRHSSPFFCALEAPKDTIFSTKTVELLLSLGASVDGVDQREFTPLQLALGGKKYETGAIRLLFDALKADANAVSLGDTLLHFAIKNKNYKLSAVKFLLERGADVHRITSFGLSALHLAANNCNLRPSLVGILVKRGVDVNAVDQNGRSPLRVAVETRKDFGVLQSLLAVGARIKKDMNVLLKMVLHNFLGAHGRLECKILLKYFVLENPSFNFHGIRWDDIDSNRGLQRQFANFVADCVQELKEMESMSIGQGRSLREFLGHSAPQINEAELDQENYEGLNQLLREVPENEFPTIYFDILSTRVHRSSIETKLEEVQLYTLKYCPYSTCIQRKVVLNYECACKITGYLSRDDFLRLMFGFCNAVNHAQVSCDKKRNLEGETSPQQSAKFPKLP